MSQGNNSQHTRKQQLSYKKTIVSMQGNNSYITRKQQLGHKETIVSPQRNNSQLTRKKIISPQGNNSYGSPQANISQLTRKQKLTHKETIVSHKVIKNNTDVQLPYVRLNISPSVQKIYILSFLEIFSFYLFSYLINMAS